MNTVIYLIRHGELAYPLDAEGNKLMYPPQTPLSEIGVAEMIALSHKLKEGGVHLDKIYAGEHTRLEQSARIMVEDSEESEIVPDFRFSDPWIPGWWLVPLSVQEELNKRGEDIYMNPRSEDQEHYEALAKRAIDGFHDVRRSNEGKAIGIVSTGDTSRLILWKLEHPEGAIPNMSVLNKFDYLKRGEAWRLILDAEGRLIEKELIAKEGASSPGEKELAQDSTPIRRREKE